MAPKGSHALAHGTCGCTEPGKIILEHAAEPDEITTVPESRERDGEGDGIAEGQEDATWGPDAPLRPGTLEDGASGSGRRGPRSREDEDPDSPLESPGRGGSAGSGFWPSEERCQASNLRSRETESCAVPGHRVCGTVHTPPSYGVRTQAGGLIRP